MAARKRVQRTAPPITHTFTIDRSAWQRGYHFGVDSRLLSDAGPDDPLDGTMCCLGFYLQSCGVSRKRLLDAVMPTNVPGRLPRAARWLLDYPAADSFAKLNDRTDLDHEVREKRIAAAFRHRGIRVKFIGRTPPKPEATQ